MKNLAQGKFPQVKVMLSSRDDAQLRRKLKADSILSLKEHHSSVTSSIATYVQLRFTDIKERVHESTISQQSMDNMKQIIVQRANGEVHHRRYFTAC
jgi:hypothetical protein